MEDFRLAFPPRNRFCLVTQCSRDKKNCEGDKLSGSPPLILVELWSRKIVGLSKRKEEKGKKESEKLFQERMSPKLFL